MSNTPTLLWLRRDLRLADHPALEAAIARGGPVIPVYIRDGSVDDLGAAPQWRLGLGIARFSATLGTLGSRIILRSGEAAEVLDALIQETGAGAVYWSRLYGPAERDRDAAIKTDLTDRGLEARSFNAHLLFEPWTVETKTGGMYRVYSPMWRAVKDREVAAPVPAPSRIPAPDHWPHSEDLDAWSLGAAMRRGAAVCLPHQRIGEEAARDRVAWFLDGPIDAYKAKRDFPALDVCSGMSENLTYGEVSARTLWHAGLRMREQGAAGAEHWLKELTWREFAYHLYYHTPEIATRNWRPEWDSFPWSMDADKQVEAWKQGRTGLRFVDAAMREMYVTGKMHNRARMIVASVLTKNMLKHWKIGMDWFAECLTDWDPASNAMGWQWVAGSGPDAAPYFRIFNPETQLDKFDADGAYQRAWIAEGADQPTATALSYFDAVPRSWGLRADAGPPEQVVDLAQGRARALAAYEARDKS